jgi:hypothetical protein
VLSDTSISFNIDSFIEALHKKAGAYNLISEQELHSLSTRKPSDHPKMAQAVDFVD